MESEHGSFFHDVPSFLARLPRSSRADFPDIYLKQIEHPHGCVIASVGMASADLPHLRQAPIVSGVMGWMSSLRTSSGWTEEDGGDQSLQSHQKCPM